MTSDPELIASTTKGAGVSDHNPHEIARRVLELRDRVFAIPLGVGRGTERYEAQQEYELACIAYADDLAQALTEALAREDALVEAMRDAEKDDNETTGSFHTRITVLHQAIDDIIAAHDARKEPTP
jgi:hypothetical protein